MYALARRAVALLLVLGSSSALRLHGNSDPLLEPTTKEIADATVESKRADAFAAHAFAARSSTASPNATVSFVKAPNAAFLKAPEDSSGKLTFEGFYNNHKTGHGIWKWSNALDAYERHFGGLAGTDVKMAEVGVQSGGSLEMWQSVLGEKCHIYGLDINKACMKFSNEQTTITIGDQGDPKMWQEFFNKTAPQLDILVDDGGHEPHQMRVTLVEVFNRIEPGGFVAIEDIHGRSYVDSFFLPTAQYLAHQATEGNLHSVHVYPYLMIAHKAGKSRLPHMELVHAEDRTKVSDFAGIWKAVEQKPGITIELQNADWGPFFTQAGIGNFFAHFAGLHDYDYYATPAGCEHTPAAYCRNTIKASSMQALVSGIHIYPNSLIVDSPQVPPVINALRMGTEWQSYD